MTDTLIPGIYTSYELSGVRYTGKASGVVGLVWKGEENETEVYAFTSCSGVAAAYGADSEAVKLCRLLFNNGAKIVKAVQTVSDYETGFDLLMKENDVTVMTCDSAELTVHIAMKEAILGGKEDAKYRVGIVGGNGQFDDVTDGSCILNCERIAMLPDIYCAVAFAGLVAGTQDPSLPFNGAVLEGVEGELAYDENSIEAMLYYGATPVRIIGGKCEVVRAVTTRTATDEIYDSTWRDLNTVLITDYVIPKVRGALRAMFPRAKNTERTRGAVRTQVIIELEKMLDLGIIESYGNVSAVKSENDPAVCEVGFEFAVSGGMHQIIIAAGIIV